MGTSQEEHIFCQEERREAWKDRKCVWIGVKRKESEDRLSIMRNGSFLLSFLLF